MILCVTLLNIILGTVTRTYHFKSALDGSAHCVQIRHNTYSGYRYVMLDANEQRGTEVIYIYYS
jgi:hypothetical protein